MIRRSKLAAGLLAAHPAPAPKRCQRPRSASGNERCARGGTRKFWRWVAWNTELIPCPISNSYVADGLKASEIKSMLDGGVRATINSDDPAYFSGYLNENLIAVQGAAQLSRDEIVQLARNAFTVSWSARGGRQGPVPGRARRVRRDACLSRFLANEEGSVMTTGANFTDEEWGTMQKGVTGAGMLVSLSDRDFTDSFGEASALAKYLGGQRENGETEFVRALVNVHGTRFGMTGSAEKVKTETLGALRSAESQPLLRRRRTSRAPTAGSSSVSRRPSPRRKAESKPARPPRSTQSRRPWARSEPARVTRHEHV